MDLAELGSRIKRRREERGLRQSDVANALRLSPQAVSKWERGENAPDIVLLVPLARLLDVSVEWLLGGSPVERETFDAAVLVTTWRGFAARSYALRPRELAAWINGIHSTVTEAALHFDGVPVKYVGDGFLAFFAGARMSERAARAALRAQRLVESDDFGVALHRGPIHLGRIGHPDYAALDILGAAVNTAFLVLPQIHACCPGRIAATRALIEDLPPEIEARAATSFQPTGRDSMLELFELSERRSDESER